MRNSLKYLVIFVIMAFTAYLLPDFAQALDLTNFYPVYETDKEILSKNSPKAIIVGDITNRKDAVIVSEFSEICNKYKNTVCICSDSSKIALKETKEYMDPLKDRCYLFKAKSDSDGKLYVLLLKNNGEMFQKLQYSPKFELKLSAYLGFLNGDYGEDVLDEKLKEVTKLEKTNIIIPRLNFILMLEKKGMREKAIEELDKVAVDNNTDELNLLLVGQTYLRLNTPEKALKVFSMCGSDECKFYKGVCFYLLEDFQKAKKIFTNLKDSPNVSDKAKYYLEKIEEDRNYTDGDSTDEK